MHFLYRVNPPRPTFAADLSADEAAIMSRHVAYWTDQLERGTIVAFGPVADPGGGYGIGVLDVPDEDTARALIAADPVVTTELMTTDLFPMPRAVVRPFRSGQEP